MKRIFIFTIILLSNNLLVKANIDSKASKMFFYNNELGVIVIEGNAIMLTNDGCNSWTTIKINTQEKLRKVFFSSIDVGWIIGDSTIYKSLDGGHTWSKNITFERTYLHTLYFTNENKGFVDLMLSKGHELENISVWMGHSTLDRTWKSYKQRTKYHIRY